MTWPRRKQRNQADYVADVHLHCTQLGLNDTATKQKTYCVKSWTEVDGFSSDANRNTCSALHLNLASYEIIRIFTLL